MAIFVDALFSWTTYRGDRASQASFVGRRNGHRWCHMITDGPDDELHEFAQKIGLKRGWFQGDHYDLVPSKRTLAVKLGAIEVEGRRIVEILRERAGLEPLWTTGTIGTTGTTSSTTTAPGAAR